MLPILFKACYPTSKMSREPISGHEKIHRINTHNNTPLFAYYFIQKYVHELQSFAIKRVGWSVGHEEQSDTLFLVT